MKQIALPAVIVGIIASNGCTHIAQKRDRVQTQLDEHSRALTTGVVEALQLQPERDPFSELALDLARTDQRIEGLPLKPIPVEQAVTNDATLHRRFEQIEKLLASRRDSELRLLEFGARFEQERNARRARWSKWIGSTTFLIGGAIALCVFFPAAIPLLGRIFAWIVGRIPSLAGALGVVSVKAFDAVVRGVEKSRTGGDQNLPNSANYQPADSLLETHLAREMDGAHKALVRARKAALKL